MRWGLRKQRPLFHFVPTPGLSLMPTQGPTGVLSPGRLSCLRGDPGITSLASGRGGSSARLPCSSVALPPGLEKWTEAPPYPRLMWYQPSAGCLGVTVQSGLDQCQECRGAMLYVAFTSLFL